LSVSFGTRIEKRGAEEWWDGILATVIAFVIEGGSGN
jgi:hypothetical protein